jgi:hypothetical protein
VPELHCLRRDLSVGHVPWRAVQAARMHADDVPDRLLHTRCVRRRVTGLRLRNERSVVRELPSQRADVQGGVLPVSFFVVTGQRLR